MKFVTLTNKNRQRAAATETEGGMTGAVASWTAPALWRFWNRDATQSARGLAQSKTLRKFERARQRRCQESAFTLAEVLAALMFLAIVIPVAVEALHVSSLAGEVAARKGVAARVADRILNESLITTNWDKGTQSGTVTEGALDFRWTLTSENWPQDTMQLLTAEVKYSAQGRDYSVKLSTLANPQTLNTGLGLQP
jgi:type II secretory pathway pseudopilin PulG